MSWIETQGSDVIGNMKTLLGRLNATGITNHFAQAGILAIVSKESSILPKNEKSYKNTSNERIRKVFGSRMTELSEDQLTLLKKNEKAFFNHVYNWKFKTGKDLGNDQPNDGYNYRGRGFNQLTGKAAYKKYGDKAGIDIVNNPDLLNQIPVACDILIAFYKHRFLNNTGKLALYHSTGINDFSNVNDAVGAFYHANTGWGKTTAQINADTTGGHAKAMERGPEFLAYIQKL